MTENYEKKIPDFLVVFEYIGEENPSKGLRYIIPFGNEEKFNEWYQKNENQNAKPIAKGVPLEEAQYLCSLVSTEQIINASFEEFMKLAKDIESNPSNSPEEKERALNNLLKMVGGKAAFHIISNEKTRAEYEEKRVKLF